MNHPTTPNPGLPIHYQPDREVSFHRCIVFVRCTNTDTVSRFVRFVIEGHRGLQSTIRFKRKERVVFVPHSADQTVGQGRPASGSVALKEPTSVPIASFSATVNTLATKLLGLVFSKTPVTVTVMVCSSCKDPSLARIVTSYPLSVPASVGFSNQEHKKLRTPVPGAIWKSAWSLPPLIEKLSGTERINPAHRGHYGLILRDAQTGRRSPTVRTNRRRFVRWLGNRKVSFHGGVVFVPGFHDRIGC